MTKRRRPAFDILSAYLEGLEHCYRATRNGWFYKKGKWQ